ncbi:MAG: GNAT family N-acetyltransferase [Christensenellales bacterium]
MVRLPDEPCLIDTAARTRAYYAGWLGLSDFPAASGCVYFAGRNEPPRGYADRVDVFALSLREGGAHVGYGDAARAGIAALDLTRPLPEALYAAFGKRPGHAVKYEFCALPAIQSRACLLTADDFPAWHAFYRALFSGDDGWMAEYYEDLAASGMAYGVFVDGWIVSATDLPSMPHMADRVREIGINTLPAHRGRGYAREACAGTLRAMLARGICPTWSARADNIASRRLAEGLGFQEFGDAYLLTL